MSVKIIVPISVCYNSTPGLHDGKLSVSLFNDMELGDDGGPSLHLQLVVDDTLEVDDLDMYIDGIPELEALHASIGLLLDQYKRGLL